jgi:periplasmic divalent cation tolerance protein
VAGAGEGLAILLTTVGDAEAARSLARAVIEARLAACVQIAPVESLYEWNGAIEESGEFMLQMKHRVEDYADLAAFVRRRHGYETPEILRVDVADVDPTYLSWARAMTAR